MFKTLVYNSYFFTKYNKEKVKLILILANVWSFVSVSVSFQQVFFVKKICSETETFHLVHRHFTQCCLSQRVTLFPVADRIKQRVHRKK